MKKSPLTTGLGAAGTVLAWLPIVATFTLSVAGSMRAGRLRFDYLMPAELFPIAWLGAGLLLVAAIRARSHRAVIGWSVFALVGSLVASQAIAVATGLASGEAEPVGWRLFLVAGLLGAYTLALVVLGLSGVSLVRTLRSADGESPRA